MDADRFQKMALKQAYNLNLETKAAAKEGFLTKTVTCFIQSGTVHFKDIQEDDGSSDGYESERLAAKWLAERNCRAPRAFGGHNASERVSAVAYLAGDKWRVWKQSVVWESLGGTKDNVPTAEKFVGRICGVYIPVDLSFGLRSPESECLRYARFFLERVASLYLRATKALPDVASIFATPERRFNGPSADICLAMALTRARDAIFDVIEHTMHWPNRKEGEEEHEYTERMSTGHYLNGSRMLLQGFTIRDYLAQAESVLESQPAMKLLVKQKAGRSTFNSRFWSWLNQRADGKEVAKDVFNNLNGIQFEDATLNIKDDTLFADSQKVCTQKSFISRFRRKRVVDVMADDTK